MPFSRTLLERETPEFTCPLLRQTYIRLTTACRAQCKRRCTKHASLISTTSNIISEPSRPSWITPSLLQLCFSGVVVFQFVSGRRWLFRVLLLILTLCFCDNCGLRSLRSLVESNSYRLIFRSDFLAIVSYDVWRSNTWLSFNLQGTVMTLFRCGGHLLY